MAKKVNIEMVDMNISRSKICMMRKPLGWQEVITRQCPETKRESVNWKKDWHRASQTINNERTTVIVGDCIIKNVQGIKLAKTVGQRVVVKPFPGATMRHAFNVVPTLDRLLIKFVYIWVPTIWNHLPGIICTERCGRCYYRLGQRGWECFRVWNSYIWTNCKEWWLLRRR